MEKLWIFIRLIACICVCRVGTGCKQGMENGKSQDPRVIRSVLDQKPRMLTAAVHPNYFLAYHVETGSLYKAWKGDLALNGAAFNNLKTIQPTSVGISYLADSSSQATWTWIHQGQIVNPTFSYKGHEIQGNYLYLYYQLMLEGVDTLSITESPALRVGPDNRPILTRNFGVANIPKGDTLLLYDASGGIRLFQQKNFWEKTLEPQAGSEITEPVLAENPTSRARLWLEKSGCNTCHEMDAMTIGPGYRQIAERHAGSKDAKGKLTQSVQAGSIGKWREVAMPPHPHLAVTNIGEMVRYILSLKPSATGAKPKGKPKTFAATVEKPGWGAPLTSIHPAFDLVAIRPSSFKPRVGGLDFLPDGRLLVSTWDSLGAVYILSNLETDDPNQVQVKRIAEGLAEPLGIKVVDGEIYVLQKQELTHLVDRDGDDHIDYYRTVSDDFAVTADFHEFSYGLEYLEGYFYANLGLAMRLMEHEWQLPDRGKTIRISMEGEVEWVNSGLRQPNGIGKNQKGQLFITENQGRWVPACKFIHVQEGSFEGCRLALKDSLPGLKMRPPAVWLPQDEIGNSPSQPVEMLHGPYKGQLIHGEVTHGGLKRVFLEQVGGAYQGCVFRFSQGLEAGINRMAWAPDSTLYVGGVGMNGNWAWNGAQFGLQKLRYNGKVPFEMLAVRANPTGISLEFTKPIDLNSLALEDLKVQQWTYIPTTQYGGPKHNLESLNLSGMETSEDKKTVHLTLDGMKAGYVLYVRLPEEMKSQKGASLWTGEAWYTLNQIPQS